MLYQATCVAIGGRGLLIEGEPGSGKSSLALALIDRGAELVGDDGVVLHVDGGQLHAAPAPATAGLLEVRNVGLVRYVPRSDCRIALVIRLDPAAPRFIDRPDAATIAGVTLPLVRLWPDSPVLPLRAEAALTLYGA